MTKDAYKQALVAAEKDMAMIQAEKETLALKQLELEKKWTDLAETVQALRTLLNEGGEHTPILKLGLTDAIREVLRTEREWATPSVIRARLEKIGYIFGTDKPVSAIATVLGRLPDVESMAAPDGSKAYRLKQRSGIMTSDEEAELRRSFWRKMDAAAGSKLPDPSYGAPDSLANQMTDGRLPSKESLELETGMRRKREKAKKK